MKKYLLPFCLCCLFCGTTSAQNELFETKTFTYKGTTLPYSVSFPDNYDKSKAYPLVLFLHGAGERGTDNTKQLTHGAWLFTDAKNRADYPAIVLFPQCPENDFWAPVSRENGFEFLDTKKMTPSMESVKKLIDQYIKKEAVDKNRIYVLGLSMGGMGTFDLICRYPKTFAAAIPICGGVELSRLKKVKHLPIRIYHGDSDTVVSPENSRNAYIELKAEGSDLVEYYEYAGVGHESWSQAFEEPDFLEWLFSQKK
ncbi:MAG: prolyl oligopeptidase family serine peptidase [Prevotellaceae bacterium]|jgi:predicted peptidase|nr:prolyl oligopeptidase family serine peptidase [Prevotellaceae bacterium]